MKREKACGVAGKKLLVLGGTHQQMKFVEAAHELGVHTIVVDYLEESPAKVICGKAYNLSITDVDGVVSIAKREAVDGVICGYIDPAQRPYVEVCERLSLPCYGTRYQFHKLTDKQAFKRLCQAHGVDVIPEYGAEDINAKHVLFPVFVKPVDSRGSRGQSVCRTYEELERAVELAKAESSNGEYIVEKYLQNSSEFQVTYFFIDGDPHLIRTADSYTGSVENGLEKVVLCAISPSRHTSSYLEHAHGAVVSMLKGLGVDNGPAFMQGFVDENAFRFFDPGLRFPGVDYERIFHKVFDLDLAKAMVIFALTGKMPPVDVPNNSWDLASNTAAILFPTVKAGVVADDSCLARISKDPSVVSCLPRASKGDVIQWSYNVNQRFAEIDILEKNKESLVTAINRVQNELTVTDENGDDMLFEIFETDQLSAR